MNFVDESNIPKSYICPISKVLMEDPVQTCDGHTYERNRIEKWLSNNNTSPITGLKLDNKNLISNYTLKGAINEFIEKNKNNHKNNISEKLQSTNINKNSKDIYLLLDVSSSMNERHRVEGDTFITTMEIAKHSAKTVVKMLSSSDRLCIITFSHTISLKMNLINMNEENKTSALAIIENIKPSGSTDIWGSLLLSFDIIKNRQNKNNFSCICLLTDGQPNKSPPRGELYEMNQIYTHELNCVLNTYAFGTQPDRFLLKSLSDVTYGLFSNIPSADMVGTTFINTIASLLCMSIDDYNKRKLKQSNDDVKFKLYNLLYSIVNDLKKKHKYSLQLSDLNKYKNNVLDFISIIKENNDYNTNTFYKNIVHDLEDQVIKALSNVDWYIKWGEGYILMLANAHQYEICNNFKDHSVQVYSNDEFEKIRNNGEEIFKSIPPPKAITSNSFNTHYRGRTLSGSHMKQSQLVNTMTLIDRSGGCILQGSKICMKNKKWKNIENVTKGDIILNDNNKEMKVICVTKQICKNTQFIKLGKLYITPYHPIKIKSSWIYPIDISNEYYTFNEPYYMYNLYVGEGGHMIVDNYIAATLGNKLNDNNVINNNFWSNTVINDLKNFDGWDNGIIQLHDYNYIRDNNNNVISLINN